MPLSQSIYGRVSLWCILTVLLNGFYSQVESSDGKLFATDFESVVTVHNGTPESPGSSSITITAPAVNTGDVLIAQITVAKDFSPSNVICTPPGWVSIFRNHYEYKVIQQLFYFVADTDYPETSYTWDFKRNNGACGTQGNNLIGKGATGGIIQYSGVDPLNPIDSVAGRVASSSGTIAVAPSVTTSENGSRVIRFFSAFKDNSFTTINNRLYTTGSSNNSTERTAAAYHTTQQNAGPTNSFNAFMSSSAEWVSATVALRPVNPPVVASQLAFKTQPSTTVAGQTISPAIEVAAVDNNNNIDPFFTGTISIQINTNPGNGTLSGNVQKNAQNGIAVFNDLSIDKAGNNYTLSATTSGLNSSVSSSFNILSGTAASIAIISGNNQTGLINTPLDNPFVVEVRDNQGNPVTDSIVHFAITETPSGSTGQSISNATGTTNANGRTGTILTPGNKGGAYRVRASVSGISDVTFTATVPMYTVSGTVSESDMPLANVSIEASGGHQQIVPTNSSGHYTISEIPAGVAGITITPSKTGYEFSPSSTVVDGPVVQNIININFVTLPPPAPTLTAPADGEQDMMLPVSLMWETNERTQYYRVQIATNPTMESDIILDISNITTTQYSATNLDYGKTYYWRIYAVNPSGASEWAVIRSFSTKAITSHTLALRSGWNSISSYILPLEDSLTELFSDISDNLVIVKNGTGSVFLPELNIHEIASWQHQYGYQVYLYPDPDTLTFTGVKVKPELTPIPLYEGWNMISYLRTDPMEPTDALKSIESNLIVAKNGSGQVYLPAGIIWDEPINTMGNMYPGIGYQLYLTDNAELYYPDNDIPVEQIASSQSRSSAGIIHGSKTSTFPLNTETGNSTILIIDSNDFTEGDEVGVWTESGNLVGNGTVDNNLAIITIWGKDTYSKQVTNGAEQNELLRLTLRSADNKQENKLNVLSLYDIISQTEKDTKLRYQKDAVWKAVVEIDNRKPNTFALHQNYPNPFNPSTTIQYAIAHDTHVLLEVYNVLGQRVSILVDEEQTAGIYDVVFTANSLSSGTYFYRIHAGDFIETKRFIILK